MVFAFFPTSNGGTGEDGSASFDRWHFDIFSPISGELSNFLVGPRCSYSQVQRGCVMEWLGQLGSPQGPDFNYHSASKGIFKKKEEQKMRNEEVNKHTQSRGNSICAEFLM